MQCVACKKYIDKVSNGFSVCPHCGSVNIPPIIPTNPLSQLLINKHTPANLGKTRRFTNINLLIAGVLLALLSISGLTANQNLFQTDLSSPPPAVQIRTWETEDNMLEEAENLIAENKLDEAAILLAQVDNSYPRYQEVLDLQKAIETKKAEIAKQVAVTQPRIKPVSTAPAMPAAPLAAFTTPVQIRGDAGCQSSTIEALKLLSHKAPAHYATVTKYVGIIECASQGSGMFAYENPTRYLVGDATRNAGTVWYAGTIAHDAGHSQLYHAYLIANPGSSVPNDVWTGESAEKTCLEAQHDALSKIGGTQYQLDYIRNVINTQYYNVPYDQRWW